jgi:hypothetical protein
MQNSVACQHVINATFFCLNKNTLLTYTFTEIEIHFKVGSPEMPLVVKAYCYIFMKLGGGRAWGGGCGGKSHRKVHFIPGLWLFLSLPYDNILEK